jgi:uncharacterized protein YbjT (DUF2867 family)
MTRTVLVTGATGNVGSHVAAQLAGRSDLKLRVFVRDAGKAAALAQAGAEIATGDFEDAAPVRAAMRGVDTVVLITAAGPHAVDLATAAVAAARAAGVRRIVRLSVINAAEDGPTDNVRQHGRTDKAIRESGLTYTLLRPNFFMQNMLAAAGTINAEGSMYYGMGDGKIGIIDSRDIADALVGAVLSEDFNNQVLDLTGPESLSMYDMAGILSEALRRPVRYVAVPPEAVEQSLRQLNMGDWFPGVMRDYSAAYARGWGDVVTDAVPRLSGHPARSYATFAREVMAPAVNRQGTAQGR